MELDPRVDPVCDGTCFDFITPEPSGKAHEIPHTELPNNDSPSLAPDEQDIAERLYFPLSQWQTRLLRLHPRSYSQRSTTLTVDLVVVDLLDTDGVTIAGSSNLVHYEALSYTWGSQATASVVICNDVRLSITGNLAAALNALQPCIGQERYLWVDAICINQEDDLEKADQVAKMLRIYQKAKSVTAWLGQPGEDDALGFACINNHALVEKKLILGANKHSTQCQRLLARLHEALTAIYGRPWLRRTWVRQEVYGARTLMVQCGTSLSSWDAFVSAAVLLNKTRASGPVDPTVSLLLNDFMKSAQAPSQRNPAYKPPRDLVSLLLSSKYYGVTNEIDTVYALLGMAGIPTTSPAREQHDDIARTQGIIIDYSNNVAKVYQATSTMLLRRVGDIASLTASFYFYQRPHASAVQLPTWVMNWRSCRCSDAELATIVELWRTPGPTWKISKNLANNALDEWPWPKISDHKMPVLEIHCHVLNYVAYLTDYTCELEEFVDIAHRSIVGPAGNNIHLKSKPGIADRCFPTYLFDPAPAKFQPFDPATHNRRCAILGVSPRTWALALVPSNAQKGDLVVAIAPGTLPLLIRSVGGNPVYSGLYAGTDWYESCVPPNGLWTKLSYWHRLGKTLWRYCLFYSGFAALSLGIFGIVFVAKRIKLDVGIAFCVVSGVLVMVLAYLWMLKLHSVSPIPGSFQYRALQDRLDETCSKLGPDFEFHGPVFVRQHNPDGGESRDTPWSAKQWRWNNLHELKLHKLKLH